MEAARLRDRVRVEELTSVSNGQGGFRSEWTVLEGAASVPAEIVAMSGVEALRLGVERSTQQYRIRIRRRASLELTPKNRLKWVSSANEVMAIRSAIPDTREPRALLVLIAEIGNGS